MLVILYLITSQFLEYMASIFTAKKIKFIPKPHPPPNPKTTISLFFRLFQSYNLQQARVFTFISKNYSLWKNGTTIILDSLVTAFAFLIPAGWENGVFVYPPLLSNKLYCPLYPSIFPEQFFFGRQYNKICKIPAKKGSKNKKIMRRSVLFSSPFRFQRKQSLIHLILSVGLPFWGSTEAMFFCHSELQIGRS